MSLLTLRIRGRLYGGFGALVLSGLAMAGFGVYQLGQVGEQVTVMANHSVNTIRGTETETELQAIRRALLRYVVDQDAASDSEAAARLAKTVDALKDAMTQTPAPGAERRRAYADLLKIMDELVTQRQALHSALARMSAAKAGALSEIARLNTEFEKFLAAAGRTEFASAAEKLEVAILKVRVVIWRLQTTRDQKSIDELKAGAAAVMGQIAAIEKTAPPPALAAPLAITKAAFEKYTADLIEASVNLLAGDQIYHQSIMPLTTAAIAKMADIRSRIGDAFQDTMTATQLRIRTTTTLQQIIVAMVTILGALTAFLIARGIVRPLAGLTSGMAELAGGNFNVELPGTERKDEVGDMARAVEGLKVKAAEKAREEAEARAGQDRAIAEARKHEMHKLADDFEQAVGRIIETVSSASNELESSASTLTATADHSQELAGVVASASEEASNNVQSVASATEELTSSVNEISRQVQDSARIAQQAVEQADRTNERIGELAKAANRIGDVLDLITTIAGQTNLLALNATIEAARAGEAGRGFAVVATEVKALADQTAKATGEISQQIAGMQTATQESVNAIREIGATIGQMSEIAATIASAVEEQGAATQEIARNIQNAAQGTQQVSSNITDVRRGASETGSASSQVLSAAQSLASESSRLKREVGSFLDTVRAA